MRRQKAQSSFDLFLDAVCNTFGGVLLIALLIVIQVRHTVEQPSAEICSPERIAELMHRADELAVEIKAATLLLETMRKTIPEPVDESGKVVFATYSELLVKKDDLVARKTDRSRDLLAQAKDNVELSLRLKEIEAQLKELQEVESRMAETVHDLQNAQQANEQNISDLKHLVRSLETEVVRKTELLQDKQDPDKNSHQEELHLPRMQDSGRLLPFYLVLRHNRLYVAAQRDDFDHTGSLGDQLGVPKPSRGFFVDDSNTTKRKINDTFHPVSPATHYIGIFVYGDSVDSFYLVRDTIMGAGFRYELILSPDDTIWSFGRGNGNTQVQ